MVGDRQVQLAIAIEVAHRDGISTTACVTDAQWRLEGSIAIPEQYRNRVGSLSARTVVSHYQIQFAIAIHVGHRHHVRTAARREGPLRRPEGSIAIPQ